MPDSSYYFSLTTRDHDDFDFTFRATRGTDDPGFDLLTPCDPNDSSRRPSRLRLPNRCLACYQPVRSSSLSWFIRI
jgi:hypothetical protein